MRLWHWCFHPRVHCTRRISRLCYAMRGGELIYLRGSVLKGYNLQIPRTAEFIGTPLPFHYNPLLPSFTLLVAIRFFLPLSLSLFTAFRSFFRSLLSLHSLSPSPSLPFLYILILLLLLLIPSYTWTTLISTLGPSPRVRLWRITVARAHRAPPHYFLSRIRMIMIIIDSELLD